jgi:hypothetical protein
MGQGDYCGVYDPTIEDSYSYQTVLDGLSLSVDILDTAGADQFVHVQGPGMKSCDIFVLVRLSSFVFCFLFFHDGKSCSWKPLSRIFPSLIGSAGVRHHLTQEPAAHPCHPR